MVISSSIFVTAPVGRGGRNNPDDVRIIQKRLNALSGASRPPLVVDGLCGPRTQSRIADFQRSVVGMSRPDSRIDPNGRTLRALNDPVSANRWQRMSLVPSGPGQPDETAPADYTADYAPPTEWGRFCALCRTHAPGYPAQLRSEAQRDTEAAVRGFALTTLFLKLLGVHFNPHLDLVMDITQGGLKSDSMSAFLQELVDIGLGRSAEHVLQGSPMAGPFVAGLISIVRGYAQTISRVDGMVQFLTGNGAFTYTMARTALESLDEDIPYARVPLPYIPTGESFQNRFLLYSENRREAFLEGVRGVLNVLREIDNVREPSGWYPSKRCMVHICVAGADYYGRESQRFRMWEKRDRCERFILREVLAQDLRQMREQLVRWARE